MPRYHRHNSIAPAPKAPPLAPIAALLLAALVTAALGPAIQTPPAAPPAPVSEDWHGNVMRSHWTGAQPPR